MVSRSLEDRTGLDWTGEVPARRPGGAVLAALSLGSLALSCMQWAVRGSLASSDSTKHARS